jgi:hypothetical protein
MTGFATTSLVELMKAYDASFFAQDLLYRNHFTEPFHHWLLQVRITQCKFTIGQGKSLCQ